jgi:PAS domain S-box-containing protein
VNDNQLKDSLQELYEHAPCGYVFTRPDGAFLRVNQTFLDMTGYARDELLDGHRLQDMLTTPGRIFYENQFFPLLRMQGFVKGVTFDLRRASGELLSVLVNSVQRTDDAGRPLLVASTVFDATDRRMYERELLAARGRAEQLAVVVREAGDAIATTSPDGEVQTWNLGAERLFGYAAEEMRGRRLGTVLIRLDEEGERARILAELWAGRRVHLETIARCADGEEIDVSVGLTPHLGPLGQLEAISSIVRDIGERVRAHSALEEERDAFLATLSHDLKNPLTGILGYAQMLARRARRGEAPDWLPPAAQQIETNARRSIAMLDGLLDLAQLRMGRALVLDRQPTDLVALARAAVAQHQATTDHHRVELAAETPDLVGDWDRTRLARVLDNLLGNAIKYSPEGGAILVEVRREGDAARLAVRDQGIGIPAAELPAVFERFARASNAAGFVGTGLGLSSVQHLVRAHGGEVTVASEEGTGTTFVVRLPLAADRDGQE